MYLYTDEKINTIFTCKICIKKKQVSHKKNDDFKKVSHTFSKNFSTQDSVTNFTLSCNTSYHTIEYHVLDVQYAYAYNDGIICLFQITKTKVPIHRKTERVVALCVALSHYITHRTESHFRAQHRSKIIHVSRWKRPLCNLLRGKLIPNPYPVPGRHL